MDKQFLADLLCEDFVDVDVKLLFDIATRLKLLDRLEQEINHLVDCVDMFWIYILGLLLDAVAQPHHFPKERQQVQS